MAHDLAVRLAELEFCTHSGLAEVATAAPEIEMSINCTICS